MPIRPDDDWLDTGLINGVTTISPTMRAATASPVGGRAGSGDDNATVETSAAQAPPSPSAASAQALRYDLNAGSQIQIGSAKADDIFSQGGFDIILADGGDDKVTISSDTEEAVVDGGAGNDTLKGGCDFFYAIGGEGSDTLTASWFGRLWGGVGAISLEWDGIDTPGWSDFGFSITELVDDGVKDVLVGGSGPGDSIYVGRYDEATGGGGAYNFATAVYSGLDHGVTLDLSGDDAIARAAEALEATMVNFTSVSVVGTRFADTVIAGDKVSTIDGGAGDDRLTVVSDDWTILNGGEGADVLIAGAGGGHMYGFDYDGDDGVRDVLTGGTGQDHGHVGRYDDFDGGAGEFDEVNIDLSWRDRSLNLDLTTDVEARLEAVTGGSYENVERYRVIGTAFDDVFRVTGALYISAGDGNDRVIGDETSNILQGGDGDDILVGGGGTGYDQFIGDTGDDLIVLTGASTDYVLEPVTSYLTVLKDAKTGVLLGDLRSIERIQFFDKTIRYSTETPLKTLFEGTEGVDHLAAFALDANAETTLNGFGGADWLQGSIGRDTLNGGTGGDIMAGAGGDDRYLVDDALDRIYEAADGGNDTVFASIHFSLLNSRNVENVTLVGSKDINARGDDRDNILTGNAGKNLLTGGKGNDTYILQTADDRAFEMNGEGTDTIIAGFDLSLAGVYVENLTLTGAARNATGNSLNNVLTGNAEANVLTGGRGDDTYVIQGKQDRVVEAAGEGTDTVISSGDFSLAGIYVENLTLAGSAKYGTGNSLNNVLTGNAAANVLTGGRGDDTYVIQTAGDRAVEKAGEGYDTVISSVDVSLAGQYLERLELTGSARFGTGNSLDNALVGNAANNVLDGGGGADRMAGGAGHDRYRVDNKGDRVYENAGQGDDVIESTINWTLVGSHVERLELKGSAKYGVGNSLDNTITGSDASNILYGGDGADILIGGKGADTLDGQGGLDRYVYRAATDSTVAAFDTVKGLGRGERLELTAIDADTSRSGDQAFALVDAFSGARGQATLDYSATTKLTTLLLDLDGDRMADMKIVIEGQTDPARILW